MTDLALIERLAALPTLAGIPRPQLEWLAARGELRQFRKGAVMYAKGQPMQELYVVLSGRFSIRLDRGGPARAVKEWKAGDLSGYLPYSRLTMAPGDVIAEERLELLTVPQDVVKEMTRECYEFTALCVHEMVDRAKELAACRAEVIAASQSLGAAGFTAAQLAVVKARRPPIRPNNRMEPTRR